MIGDLFGKKYKLSELIDNYLFLTIDQLLDAIAIILSIDFFLLKAFLIVESSGKHFSKKGKLIIRLERHIFKKYSGYQIEKYTRNQDNEYLNFNRAVDLDEKSAYMSISMGSVQIMGFNYRRAGFESAKDMYDYFNKSENYAIIAFGEFINSDKKLLKACIDFDYHNIAKRYNGKKYKNYLDSRGLNYAERIEKNHKSKKDYI